MSPQKLHLQWCIKLLQYFSLGIFSPHKETPKLNKYRITTHIVSWIILATSLGAGILNSTDFKRKALNTISFGYLLISIAIYATYFIHSNSVHNLIKITEINSRVYPESDVYTVEAERETKMFILKYLFTIMCCSVSYTYTAKSHKTEYWELRHFYAPFDIVIWGQFEAIRLIVSLLLVYHAYCLIFHDIISAALFIHVGRQFEAVAERFSKTDLSDRKLEANEAIAVLDDIDNDRAAVESGFRKAVQYHQLILKCAADLQTMFSAVFMTRMILSTSLICLCMYFVIQEINGNVVDLLGHFESFVLITYQLYIMTRSAEVTSERASLVANGIYASDWVNASPAMKRQVVWVLQRAQRPPIYTALGVLAVSSRTIISIMKAAYSLLTLLLGTEERKEDSEETL